MPTIKAGQERRQRVKRRSQGNLIKKMELTSPPCLSSFDPFNPLRKREARFVRVRVLTRIEKEKKKEKGSFFAISTNAQRNNVAENQDYIYIRMCITRIVAILFQLFDYHFNFSQRHAMKPYIIRFYILNRVIGWNTRKESRSVQPI